MKSFRGSLFIAITAIITLVLWITAVPVYSLSPLERSREIIGGLALYGFFLNFLLAARNKTLEKWFNGLDKLYVYHKYVAISIAGLLVIHAILGGILEVTDALTLASLLGWIAMVVALVLIAVTLFLSLFPYDKLLPYDKWRLTHRFMLLAYIVGLVHFYISNKYGTFPLSALSIWMGLTALIGLSCAVYVVFFYQRAGFKYHGKVSNLTRLSPNILEWEITLDRPMQFARGQFAFVKVFQKGFEEDPHPFTISSGIENRITFTTKCSGDFTKQLYDELAVGTRAALEGPFGFMDFARGKQNQLWVAGGIGITPFVAYLRGDPPEKNIELFYSYYGAEAGVYKEFFKEYQSQHPSFKLHLIDTATMPFLNFEGYQLAEETSIYMCGPRKMIIGYVDYFTKNFKNADITFEAFKLR